jgi:hypothetical protein
VIQAFLGIWAAWSNVPAKQLPFAKLRGAAKSCAASACSCFANSTDRCTPSWPHTGLRQIVSKQWQFDHFYLGMGQNLVPLVNIKIAGIYGCSSH